MYRFARYRCTVFRYIILCIFILPIIKLTSIYYCDLQQLSIESKPASLPFDIINKKVSISSINRTAIDYYRQYVERKNYEQLMLNKNLFSSKTTRYILLVQVHTRVVYLKKFIEMLQNVAMINQSLVIFSHDFIDPKINALITNITFVPVRITEGEGGENLT
jgi:hypothetical protein